MHIRHLQIENVRGFGEGEHRLHLELPPRGWIVVAGPNGSGKTTLLQSLGLVLSNTFSDDFASSLFDWKRDHVDRAEIAIELNRDADDQYASTSTGQLIGAPSRDKLSLSDQWQRVYGALSHSRNSHGNLAFYGPWSTASDGWFAAGYGAHRRLFGGHNIAERLDPRSRESALLTLFRDDAPMVEPVRWLMDLHHRSIDPEARPEEREEAEGTIALCNLLLSDGLLGASRVRSINSKGITLDVGNQSVELQRLGAGAQVLAALVIDLLRHLIARFAVLDVDQSIGVVRNTGVVLIDEVESHLHVAWQRKLGPWLTKHFPGLQFIVTTHSPFVCQSATERGLVVLGGPGADTPARIADADLHRRAVSGGVDDVLISALFGLDHTWTDQVEAKRERLASLEGRVLTGRATQGEREEFKALRAELTVSVRADVDLTMRALSES